MNKVLKTRKEYDETKAKVEQLIAEATEKGLIEPEMDNDYTRTATAHPTPILWHRYMNIYGKM